ncbi:MAG: hypothetical protein WBG70_00355 [Spirulinaceae cyanobacterium]
MTSKSPSNPPMQNPTVNAPNPSTGKSAYRPSVPITVYRQLAAELQSTQSQLGSLKAQNQQLVQQNQQLRQEVDKLLHSARDVQHLLSSLDGSSYTGANFAAPVISAQTPQPQSFTDQIPAAPPLPSIDTPPRPYLPETPPEVPEQLIVEVPESKPRRSSQPESSSDVSGWLLILAIILIVLTAFSMGFLIVRPLLNGDSNS